MLFFSYNTIILSLKYLNDNSFLFISFQSIFQVTYLRENRTKQNDPEWLMEKRISTVFIIFREILTFFFFYLTKGTNDNKLHQGLQ